MSKDPYNKYQSNTEGYDTKYNFKIILTGSVYVGKTAILNRYVDNDYLKPYVATMGLQYKIKSIVASQNKKVNLRFWDTSGEEKYKGITKQYYQKADGILLVYDITDRKSFEALPDWFSDIQECAPEDSVIVLVGNKEDLVPQRQVSIMEGKKFAQDNNLFYFTEASAKSGKNIPEIFEKMGEELLKVYNNKPKEEDNITQESEEAKPVEIKVDEQKSERTKCC